ncbi:hypothetical protein CAEBREN_07339 [Caenorhabditis brenneri]|uniref:Uncharacterized protein n=1 Tax=Caenorhabditis brenneri TaxID=135651 RepID=G0MYP4_CAEBE|nr:hypothetical protein CAEBREN_07339 [Caenorhabditis brenneri]
MKITVLILLSVMVSGVSASSAILPFLVKNQVFMGNPVPELCMDYFKSSSAKLKLDNINPQFVAEALNSGNALKQQEKYYNFQANIQSLAEKQYADHICDAAEFAPTVLSANYQFTCLEICQSCMPGSAPICFLRSPRFAGLAQVCLCTYDLKNPVDNAAFSIRHEKRVFSRKIRRT